MVYPDPDRPETQRAVFEALEDELAQGKLAAPVGVPTTQMLQALQWPEEYAPRLYKALDALARDGRLEGRSITVDQGVIGWQLLERPVESEIQDWHGVGEPPKARKERLRAILQFLVERDENGGGRPISLFSGRRWLGAVDAMSIQDRMGWAPRYRAVMSGLLADLLEQDLVEAHVIHSDAGNDYWVDRITARGRRDLENPSGPAEVSPNITIGTFAGQWNWSSTVTNTQSQIGQISGPSNQDLRDALSAVVEALSAADIEDEKRELGLEAVNDIADVAMQAPEGRRRSRVIGALAVLDQAAVAVPHVANAVAVLAPLALALVGHHG